MGHIPEEMTPNIKAHALAAYPVDPWPGDLTLDNEGSIVTAIRFYCNIADDFTILFVVANLRPCKAQLEMNRGDKPTWQWIGYARLLGNLFVWSWELSAGVLVLEPCQQNTQQIPLQEIKRLPSEKVSQRGIEVFLSRELRVENDYWFQTAHSGIDSKLNVADLISE